MNTQAFGTNIESEDPPMAFGVPVGVVIKEPPKAAAPKVGNLGPRVRIVLEDNDGIPPTGQFFGVDGKGYILRSGEPADVPPEIINILNTAIVDAPIVDQVTKQIIGYRKRLRFAYRVLAPGAEA
jgi:hypothetical protein